MNHIIENYYPVFELYQALRTQLMDLVSDEDLAFAPPNCPPLGELCKEMGEVEHAYIQSFKDFKLDFSYRNQQAGLAGSVQALQAWYAELDLQLRAVIEAFDDPGLEQHVDRGDWQVPVRIQLDIYKEALLIFYAKAWVYLRAMGKPLPEQWQHWL